MKNLLTRLFSLIICALIILSVFPSSTAAAQDADPPPERPIVEPCPPSGPTDRPCQTRDGTWIMPANADANAWSEETRDAQTTGGPDAFGYTWDDTAAYSWIDASGGTDAGFNDSSYDQKVGPISLPFSFNYYGFNYSELYITENGFISFDDPGPWWFPQVQQMPSPEHPDNLIAPYYSLFSFLSDGWVRYLSGGTAPNRYFVVSWKVYDQGDSTSDYRFQVILYENGDFAFQYHTINDGTGGYFCGISGFEDRIGAVGLTTTSFCNLPAINTRVLVSRPADAARVNIHPSHQGRLVKAGVVEPFKIHLSNTGDLGSDTYDITISSGWPVALTDSKGVPLVDTDGDGVIDTGSLAQGQTATIRAAVTPPTVLGVGDGNTAQITFTSSVDNGVSQTAHLQTAVPAPFAQIQYTSEGFRHVFGLDLVQPQEQTIKEFDTIPSDSALAAISSGFALSYEYNYANYDFTKFYSDVFVDLLDLDGNLTRTIQLTDNSSSGYYQHSTWATAAAQAANGRIGVVWVEYIHDAYRGGTQTNIFLAVLDDAGNIVVPKTQLSSNTTWSDETSYLSLNSPKIAATDDNRLVVTWNQSLIETWQSDTDVMYTIRDTSGGVVKAVTQQTSATTWYGYYYPTVAALSGGRFLLAYAPESDGVTYLIFNSSGIVLQPATNISSGSSSYLDAVQLSDGPIALVWAHGEGNNDPAFTIIDDGTYSVSHGPTLLDNSASEAGASYLSVTADNTGQAILTWVDDLYSRSNLYYTLFNSSGAVVTDPMIVLTKNSVTVNGYGYGNAPYAAAFPTASDTDLWVTAPSFVSPNAEVSVTATFGNQGQAAGTSVVLTATLDPGLNYNNASPTPASVVGNVVTWNLPDLASLAHGTVTLNLEMTSPTIGTPYPITWAITSAGTEAEVTDNTVTNEVMLGLNTFMPLFSH